MSELRVERLILPAAELGPENPLPSLLPAGDPHEGPLPETPGIPDDMRKQMAYGRVAGILPYSIQDGYNRRLKPRGFRVAVLENETLRATFLLEFGGRMRSLFHKPSGRDLLEVNPVFQPANLALRNAWFSGGVEWNIGMTGHSPFTCSPVFAARVEREDGTPALRMYEWERIRGVPFQIDVSLPDGSPVLFVWIRIFNPHDREVPMYWWSNMAVPESVDKRVLAPAVSAYSFGYGSGGLGIVSIPETDGVDVTYTARIDRAADFFFHIPDGQRPWITALDGRGQGLIQVSTDRLKGRKLFLWGMGRGGRRWQEFLSRPGHAYLEIQAGLARTQMEHLPMPAKAEWSWLEAYGLMEAHLVATHGRDWIRARSEVEKRLEDLVPRVDMEAESARSAASADLEPVELLQRGSGWGALERLRRKAAGEPPLCPRGLVFDEESLESAQDPWRSLLLQGILPEGDPELAPESHMVQAEWGAMIERAVQEHRGQNWSSWYHLGVARYAAGNREGARQAWEASLGKVRTSWALRNLAVLQREDGDAGRAADLWLEACRLRPAIIPLAVECGQALIDAGRPGEWLDLLTALPEPVRNTGRIRLLEGWAALALQDFERVETLLAGDLVIDDLREGERSLSHLWFEYHEGRIRASENLAADADLRDRVRQEYPVPERLDFRMSTDPPVQGDDRVKKRST